MGSEYYTIFIRKTTNSTTAASNMDALSHSPEVPRGPFSSQCLAAGIILQIMYPKTRAIGI